METPHEDSIQGKLKTKLGQHGVPDSALLDNCVTSLELHRVKTTVYMKMTSSRSWCVQIKVYYFSVQQPYTNTYPGTALDWPLAVNSGCNSQETPLEE